MVAHHHMPATQTVAKIIAYARQQSLPANQTDLILEFIEQFFLHASLEDLESHSIEDLFGAVLSHWHLLNKKKPGAIAVNIFNPTQEKEGWASAHTVLQVVDDDVPFLVDSIRMELNRLGISAHLMIFMGGMRVVRNAKGKVSALLPFESQSQEGGIEAPIYIEIDRQTDPKTLKEICAHILRVIDDVHMAVTDWRKMQQRMSETLDVLCAQKIPLPNDVVDESIAFLEWLIEDHFTFLGARDYEVVGTGKERALKLIPGSGLGVLRDDRHSAVYRQFSALPEQARELMLSTKQIVIMSKTNTRSTVHRPAYTDYIGVKRFNEKGELIGERRFIGLYTSTAYSSNPRVIPFVRQKVQAVMKKSGYPRRSHDGKDLIHILTNLPRDDLFQASFEEIYDLAMGILKLKEGGKTRVFIRKDAYNRFLSCLVYILRKNFSSDLIEKMQAILLDAFGGVEASFTTQFFESSMSRIHYVIRIDPKKKVQYDLSKIEKRLTEVCRSWQDGFRDNVLEYFGEERGNKIVSRYEAVFPAGYREAFDPRHAVFDIDRIEYVFQGHPLGMSFYRPIGVDKETIRFKLFRQDQTVPLSDALPILENMGLRVEGEQPYRLLFLAKKEVWINDFHMTYATEPNFEVEEVKSIFQEAFEKVWLGQAENDPFNRLVLEAQLTWREITVLRAYAKYLRQTSFMFSQDYIAETFVHNPNIARLLNELFKLMFDPSITGDVSTPIRDMEGLILRKLETVAILDEDRILRRCLALIQATVRTNFFQQTVTGEDKPYVSFKFNPEKVPELPLPLPKYEIFVYSPRIEGVHLRAGKVARGGIRWSDRREDFRTEVLGLMKAQQVKNSVIVPAGAKGGFVVKDIPLDTTREEVMELGIAGYKEFIHGLLDLTDNLVDDKVVPPSLTRCYDEPDYYLVVAADKGTATFSDIANQISVDHGFWLDDAFASGGSTGYDHKKMGITARGAWVSAERQFQELGINVDEEEITVVGIGDMSGDVFGNGLLMSRHLKLVAAFNHQHIFVDPNPDPASSFDERKRLFETPRSTWAEYQAECISAGGGVFSRGAKSIPISAEMKERFGIAKDKLVPNEFIKAILRAPVDLVWNGGVGTFVKSSHESHESAGDRTNDNIRINGNEMRARVVAEGGNLGWTQLGRIECELNGVKINTDFIDNSAGVDCSDHEVNIKILLNDVVNAGDFSVKQRNVLMAKMTNEVARLVLENNYHQNQLISLASGLAVQHFSLYSNYIESLEAQDKINRDLEFLPTGKSLLERKAAGLGLTRPELAILLAYSKNILEEEIRDTNLTKDPYLSRFIENAFPEILSKRYYPFLKKHRLCHEIVSTQISNQLVTDMGFTFTYQMYEETGAPISAIIRAYVTARRLFNMPALYADIESLDYKVDASVQHRMADEVIRLVRRTTRWFLRNRRLQLDIEKTIDHFSAGVSIIERRISRLILGRQRKMFERRKQELIDAGVPDTIALRISRLGALYHSLNIVEAASTNHSDVYQAAKIYFILVDRLDLFWFKNKINAYSVEDRWSVLAKSAYKGDLDWVQRALTIAVLNLEVNVKSITARINAWFSKHKGLIQRWQDLLTDLRATEKEEFAILSVAIRELMDLAQTGLQQSSKKE